MVRLSLALALTFSCFAARVRADDRPSSGEMSLASGRTLGNGERVLSAGLGWPGLYAEVMWAPTSRFNVGLRGSVLYGSPLMGFEHGVGGALHVPGRLHLYARGTLDVAVAFEAMAFAGEGVLAGESGAFADDLGFGGEFHAGLTLGAKASSAVTLHVGVRGGPGYARVGDVGEDIFVGTVAVTGGLEALVARDSMLFVRFEGGYGFAPERLFGGKERANLTLGLAYLL